MREVARAICAVWSGLLLAACAQVDDMPAIGRAVAMALDTINGRPVVVLGPYGSSSDRSTDGGAAAALASGFATALGIPAREGESINSTGCPRSPPTGDVPLGLWAQFGPHEAKGDSTQVQLATGCVTDRAGAFQQVHVFLLMKTHGGRWQVVARRLLMIT